MSGCATVIQSRHYRAPANDGAALLAPHTREWRDLWTENLDRREQPAVSIDGVDWGSFAAGARAQLLKTAAAYTREYTDLPDPPSPDRIIMAGHQPELSHPGVWFKNVVLSQAAQRLQATAVNLIVDNDVVSAASLRVPTGSPESPRLSTLAFDQPQSTTPFERAVVRDRAAFNSFGDRVAAAIEPIIDDPLITQLWPRVLEFEARWNNMGRALAAARHELEYQQGQQTWEIPISAVADGPWFARFVADILARVDTFIQVHNQALADYRRINRIRSAAQPVPDLTRSDADYETPFWIWSQRLPIRRRLFARFHGPNIVLTDRSEWTVQTRLADLSSAIIDWQAKGEISIRPRAITNTLFARMFLCDLFIHGIGGAKYDEVTDQVISNFYGVTPTGYATVSATIRLPIALPTVDRAELQRQRQRLRELRFHPETFFTSDVPEDVADWIVDKERWIESEIPGERKQRHEAIEQINHHLAERLSGQRKDIESSIETIGQDLERLRILGSREFSLALFPESLWRSLAELGARELHPLK